MMCFECNKKEIKEEFGTYCSQRCRDKALKELERQEKQAEKRRLNSQLRKFDEWRKSGYRT